MEQHDSWNNLLNTVNLTDIISAQGNGLLPYMCQQTIFCVIYSGIKGTKPFLDSLGIWVPQNYKVLFLYILATPFHHPKVLPHFCPQESMLFMPQCTLDIPLTDTMLVPRILLIRTLII